MYQKTAPLYLRDKTNLDHRKESSNSCRYDVPLVHNGPLTRVNGHCPAPYFCTTTVVPLINFPFQLSRFDQVHSWRETKDLLWMRLARWARGSQGGMGTNLSHRCPAWVTAVKNRQYFTVMRLFINRPTSWVWNGYIYCRSSLQKSDRMEFVK